MGMTSAVDVRKGQLIDIFPGKDANSAAQWLLSRPVWWREGIQWAALDLSRAYQAAYKQALPWAEQVADPFHVVGAANRRLTETRRRVQEENPRTTRPETRRPLPSTQPPHLGPRETR